jgi:ABC-type lipoprotein export system ATPase subunit
MYLSLLIPFLSLLIPFNCFARALANDPRLLLTDEPTGNLDTSNSHRVFDVLQHIARETHLALLIVTHNSQIAEACDRVLTMEDGKLLDG